MEHPKSLNNTDVEDLLNALEDSTETQVINGGNDALRFISHFGITSGMHPIQRVVIWKIYKKWSKNPMSKKTFGTEFGRFFPLKGAYYHINLDLFKVSKILLEQLEEKKAVRPASNRPKAVEHFKNFTDHYKIEKGDYYISWSALFYLYDRWITETNNKRPLKPFDFKQLLKTNFPIKYPHNALEHFGVKKTIVYHIHGSIIEKLRNDTNGYDKRRTKEEKQKSNDKISRIRSISESSEPSRGDSGGLSE